MPKSGKKRQQNFVYDRVAALSVPSSKSAEVARAWSDHAAKIWATTQPQNCSDKPNAPHLAAALIRKARMREPQRAARGGAERDAHAFHAHLHRLVCEE